MTFRITSNADALDDKYKRRIRKIDGALRTGLRNAAIAVDNAQVDLLRGGVAPGDYPLPVRSGNLLQGHFFRVVSDYLALVGNTASYAVAAHEGLRSHSVYGRRPFLEDAVERTDVLGDVRQEMKKAVFAL